MKRDLKIEERGDQFAPGGKFPGIRLIGKWLARAGFKPGGRVTVTMVTPGVIQLEVQR
jgi:hypothetical protein